MNRYYVTRLVLLLMVGILSQCAWFQGESTDADIIKPRPVDGYEALRTRIHFPRDLREKGIEGSVTVDVLVSASGVVEQTRVSKTLNPQLDKIASNAIQRTAFTPATRDGEAMSVWISIPIVFALSEWEDKSSPFNSFEMIVRPDPAYESYTVEMHGVLKSTLVFPLRFECLLPFNAEKSWVKTGSDSPPFTGIVRDESGEWLVFEVSDQNLSFGFDYGLSGVAATHKFSYKFALNQTLPDWQLAVIYGSQKVHFTQEPTRLVDLDEGSTRFEYDLESLDAYETRYLEIGLLD